MGGSFGFALGTTYALAPYLCGKDGLSCCLHSPPHLETVPQFEPPVPQFEPPIGSHTKQCPAKALLQSLMAAEPRERSTHLLHSDLETYNCFEQHLTADTDGFLIEF